MSPPIRVPTNAQRAIVARWPGPGVGGEELGNLKDSELELEDLEKEKTVSITCIIITVASPSLSWRYGLRVRVTGRLS